MSAISCDIIVRYYRAILSCDVIVRCYRAMLSCDNIAILVLWDQSLGLFYFAYDFGLLPRTCCQEQFSTHSNIKCYKSGSTVGETHTDMSQQTDNRSAYSAQRSNGSQARGPATTTPRRSNTPQGGGQDTEESPAAESPQVEGDTDANEGRHSFTHDPTWLGCGAETITAMYVLPRH